MLRDGKFKKVNDLVSAIDTEKASLHFIIAMLSATRSALDYLPSRLSFYERSYLRAERDGIDPEKLIGGLRGRPRI